MKTQFEAGWLQVKNLESNSNFPLPFVRAGDTRTPAFLGWVELF